jgi:hypothetical protein
MRTFFQLSQGAGNKITRGGCEEIFSWVTDGLTKSLICSRLEK